MPQLQKRNKPDLNQTNQLLGAILERVGGQQAQSAPVSQSMPVQPQLPEQGFGSGMPSMPMPQPQPQQQAQMPMPSQPQAQDSGNGFAPNFFNKLGAGEHRTPFGDFLAKMGIPLATVAAGVAGGKNNNFLAGAAGFQTGYTGELEKDRQLERKKSLVKGDNEFYTYNKETGELEFKQDIKSGARIRNVTPAQEKQISKILSQDTPESKSTEQITAEVKDKELDADTAMSILEQSGGDKNKARQLAKQQGYKF